jgi:hypothetical protein
VLRFCPRPTSKIVEDPDANVSRLPALVWPFIIWIRSVRYHCYIVVRRLISCESFENGIRDHREQATFLEHNAKPAISHTFIVSSETVKEKILLCTRPVSEYTLHRISVGNLTFRPSITSDNAHDQISLYATGSENWGGSDNKVGTWYFFVYDNDTAIERGV